MSLAQSIDLSYQEGGSDKVYKIKLGEITTGDWAVSFGYGRRGNTLTYGNKCSGVSYTEAKKIYDKLVREKTAKGYKQEGSTVSPALPAGMVEADTKDTGVRPQLLNEIEEDQVEKYINDSRYCLQEKFDGRRRLIIKKGIDIVTTNKKGLKIPPTVKLQNDALNIDYNVALDGEDMGDYIMVFDLINYPGEYQKRYEELESIVVTCSMIRCVPTAWTKEEKQRMFEDIKEKNGEGVVFKKINSLYKPGKPSSGGDHLKFKFHATASCVVTSRSSSKKSIGIGCYNSEKVLVSVGNCTVYPNQTMPDIGSIVEVRYLYYFEGGSLFQPVLLGDRDDVSLSECTIKQLKVKREESLI